MRTALLTAVAALALQTLTEAHSFGMLLKPMSRVFAPSGSAATQWFEVANDRPERIAVEVSMATLERDENYLETNKSADDDFLVYPPQMVLPVGGRQVVRVTWLGDPNPTRERAFRIIVQQLPIELVDRSAKAGSSTVGQVRIMMTYKGSVFIRPPKATAKLAIHLVEPAKSPAGASVLALTVVNVGAAGAVVAGCMIHLGAGKTAIDLPAATLGPLKKSRVLAGSRRRYLLTWPPGLPVGPVTASGQCDAEP